MVSNRNRITKFIEHLEKQGISVNIGKTKARGNNGVFIYKNENFRIDVSKLTPQDKILSVILHEYAHYIHYKYDKSLKTLDFIFSNLSLEEQDELLEISVQSIPKDFAQKLCLRKQNLKAEIKNLTKNIKIEIPDFQISKQNSQLLKNLNICAKYLLKYDSIKFNGKIYNVKNIQEIFPNLTNAQIQFFQLKSKYRALSRLNKRISKLNQYYNNPSELFARFVELYYTDKTLVEKIAPNLTKKMHDNIKQNKIYELNMLSNIIE